MKYTLTGREWKQAIVAMTRVEANRSYNALRNVLILFDAGELSDEVLAGIADDTGYEADLTCDGKGWGGIVDALGEQPAKNVLPLLNKLLANVSPQAEAEAKAAGAAS